MHCFCAGSGLLEDILMMSEQSKRIRGPILSLIIFLCVGIVSAQQTGTSPDAVSDTADSAHLEQRLDQVMTALDSMHQQLDQSRQEMDQMRAEIQQLRAQVAQNNKDEGAAQAVSSLQANVQQLKEQSDVLQSEVKQHDQTKIETMSKYPVRISGMLLFSSLLNSGTVDSIDLPILALPRQMDQVQGSLSATARQTILGIDAIGPRLWGAHSFADLSVDFFGGIPYADYTTSSGLLRLRTAHASLDWSRRSLTAEVDMPLISPLNPTSFLSMGEPALAWSGNLWTWSPQLEYKETTAFAGGKLGMELGLIDVAAPGPPMSNGLRLPSPSEQSREPGYETRISYSFPLGDHPLEVGTSGYYSRQAYSYGHHIDAWAATADWKIPFTRFLELSGEFYRGRAIGGLGGGTFKDYVPYGTYQIPNGLNAEGGWGQFKIKLTHSLEANFAIGQDNAFADDLRYSDVPTEPNNYANLARNRTAFGNVIFRPKTYLMFSAEYRNIYSWPIAGQADSNQSMGLAAGYLF